MTKTVILNRLMEPPAANSREMRAYMQAILEVSGLTAGQLFPIELFMKNYRTHLEPKRGFPYPNLKKHPDKTYELTQAGQRFFQSRLTDDPMVKGQRIDRAEVIDVIRLMVAHEPAPGWEQFQATVRSND